MPGRSRIMVFVIFVIPFMLGMAIVSYWFVSTRVQKKILLPTYGTVPQFNLVSERSVSFTRDSLLGKVTIADFIFTECAGTCPLMSATMADLQQEFLSDPRVRCISFSVDPSNDTPDVLKEYASRYKAVGGKWTFLTGGREPIYKLTRDGFHLGLDIEGDSAIIHSQKFVLIDNNAAIRGYYDMDDSEAVRTLRRDAGILSRRAGD